MTGLIDRVGILTDEVSDDLADALAWVAAERLRHVEIRVVGGKNVSAMTDEEADGVRREVERHGLFVSAVASPLFKCALDPSRPVASGDRFGQPEEGVDAHFAKLDRLIDIARLLGATRIRIFSFWRERDPRAHQEEVIHHLKQAAAVAQGAGVVLLVENEPSCNGGFADETADIVRGVAAPALRALWDPGNEAYAGREAYPAGYSAMRGLLAHVHLKDAYIAAGGESRCVPLGSGDVALLPQLRALRDDGYDGLFTIETHFTPAGGTRKMGSRMTLDALRTLCHEL